MRHPQGAHPPRRSATPWIRQGFCIFTANSLTMKSIQILGVLLIAVFMLSSCAGARKAQLADHSARLSSAAQNPNLSGEEKLDVLLTSVSGVMNQSLKITNPKKGYAYAKTYSDQNQKSINTLAKDIGKWQQGMKPIESIRLAASLARKDYVKDFIQVVPKFKRKFNQAKFLLGITGQLGGMFQFLGPILGDIQAEEIPKIETNLQPTLIERQLN